MSRRLHKLAAERSAAVAEMRAISDAAVDRDLTAEESTKFAAAKESIAALDAKIADENALIEAERNAPAIATATPGTAPLRVDVGANRAEAKPWDSFGEQLSAVMTAMSPGGSVDERLHRGLNAGPTGMSQGVPSEGGYLVDPSFSKTIWDGLNADEDNLLSLVDGYTVEGESLTFKANAETSRANGSRYGAVQGYWLAEADEITSSKVKFRDLKLEPHELGVLVYLTDKLIRNSPTALEQYVTRAATAEIGFMSGDAIVNGNGVGKPLGILESGSLVSVAKETSQAAATINQINISKMWARLHPRARKDAIWLHNVDVEPQLDALSTVVRNVADSENVGGYANKVFDPERRTLKGRPLMASEFCATLGTVGDLILFSPSAYAAGLRGAVRSAMSIHVKFVQAETAFRFMFELDGQPWLASALTPFKGSNTLSTHIALATRS